MKVTVCNSCGLTMHTGVFVCRRCNLRNLSFYDLGCESDTYRLHKRAAELSIREIRTPSTTPLFSAMLVLVITSLGLMVYDGFCHPDGFVRQQLSSVLPIGQAPKLAKVTKPSKPSM